MFTFLNVENSKAYETAMMLNNRLSSGLGLNYYQILGLNIDHTREELEKNYRDLMISFGNSSEYNEEKNYVYEAYKCFTSFLGSAWYEKNIGSQGMHNVVCQYEAMNNSKIMFKDLNDKIENKVVVNYIENKNNEFIENKIVGFLKSSNDFENISVECIDKFDIDFLGKNTAILQICDMSGNIIYCNKYLMNPDSRTLYSSDDDVIDGFKIASWGVYMTRKLELNRQNKLKKNNQYVKKI